MEVLEENVSFGFTVMDSTVSLDSPHHHTWQGIMSSFPEETTNPRWWIQCLSWEAYSGASESTESCPLRTALKLDYTNLGVVRSNQVRQALAMEKLWIIK